MKIYTITKKAGDELPGTDVRTFRSGCRHRSGDCQSVFPGFARCVCGQVFVYLGGAGHAGQYKKIEEVTEEDAKRFDPEMEQRFLEFCGR